MLSKFSTLIRMDAIISGKSYNRCASSIISGLGLTCLLSEILWGYLLLSFEETGISKISTAVSSAMACQLEFAFLGDVGLIV